MLNDDYAKHPIKVIQFGEGNFLRAFVDWMIHKMNEQSCFNGQVAVVQPLKNGMIDMLEKQNCSYTHYLKGMKDGAPYEEHYINRSIRSTVNPYADFGGFLDLAAIESAGIIISNTTEAGIEFKDSDRFEDDAAVTYPGKLTRLLYRRYQIVDGDTKKGFIIMPCELIDGNADKLKEAVLKYIDLWQLPEKFKHWIGAGNTFCNTLVDRIVPGYPRDTIEAVWQTLGYKDNLVVESELFNLWVIEGDDHVRAAFPAAAAGCNVLIVDDVSPYKMRKVRILNGAHTTLVPIAYLYGLATVRESIEDPVIRHFITKTLFKEIIPTLPLSKEALETFANEVIERFKNPFIKHYLLSISLNSMSKYKTRVLPSLVAYLDQYGHPPKGLTAALAAYIIFYRGTYQGKKIPINDNPDIIALYDRLWSGYTDTKEGMQALVKEVLAYEPNWQGDLNLISGLTERVTQYSWIILHQGIKALLDIVDEEP